MTQTELIILRLIEEKPQITQDELAKIMKITRSSVATHISNLIKKGKILGRGYIVSEQQAVFVFGGANITIYGETMNQRLHMGESNPGHIGETFGGVGLYTTLELVKNGVATNFISAVGSDRQGDAILEHLKNHHVRTDNVYIDAKKPTACCLGIRDENNQLVTAISNMEVIEALPPAYFFKYVELLKNVPYCFVDTNISEDGLAILFNHYSGKLIVNTISSTKAKKIVPYYQNIFALFASEIELLSIDESISIEDHCKILASKGVKYIFLEMQDGTYLFMDATATITYYDSIFQKNIREFLTAKLIKALLENEGGEDEVVAKSMDMILRSDCHENTAI